MVVKKTVALNEIMDKYVRKTWAILIDAGYDASYSTALNFMLLGHILRFADTGKEQKLSEILQSFLDDERTIDDLNLEDYANRVDELFEKKNEVRRRK